MRLDLILCLCAAAGVHLAVWAVAPHSAGSEAGGDGPTPQIAVAGATATALAAAWQAPVSVREATPLSTPAVLPAEQDPRPLMPDEPSVQMAPVPGLPALSADALPGIAAAKSPARVSPTPAQPAPPAPSAAADRPKAPTQPDRPHLAALPAVAADPVPQADLTPPPPRQTVTASLRPVLRPDRQAQPAPRPQAAQNAQQARAAGPATRATTSATDTARRDALRAAWGAQIQHKVHRRLAYPRDGRGTGRVRLQLTIARDGRLDAMHIIGAEGHPSFERAARTAVTRAGRFPAAPDGLPDPRYTFLLTLNMQP